MAAEKEQQSPNSPPDRYAPNMPRRYDAEAAVAHDAREQRKKKRTRCLLYVLLFVIFQSGIIALFALTVMKVRTPKFRIRQATLANYTADPTAALRATLDAQFSVKNANFGRYKYSTTTVEFFYGDAKIGDVLVPKSKAGWRSTKKVTSAAVELNIRNSPQLSGDLRGGVVRIRSSAKMSGKVELMFIMKKNRSTNMNCTMDIVTATQTLTNILCK